MSAVALLPSPAPSSGTQALHVLAVGCCPADLATLRMLFARKRWGLVEVIGYREAVGTLRGEPGDEMAAVLCTSALPDGDWRMMLETVQGMPDPPRLLVLSRLADERLWAEVLNLGGHDVLAAPLGEKELEWALHSVWLGWNRARCATDAAAEPLRPLRRKGRGNPPEPFV